jgi:hypothetical protein
LVELGSIGSSVVIGDSDSSFRAWCSCHKNETINKTKIFDVHSGHSKSFQKLLKPSLNCSDGLASSSDIGHEELSPLQMCRPHCRNPARVSGRALPGFREYEHFKTSFSFDQHRRSNHLRGTACYALPEKTRSNLYAVKRHNMSTATLQETAFHRRRGWREEWHILHILYILHIPHIFDIFCITYFTYFTYFTYILQKRLFSNPGGVMR